MIESKLTRCPPDHPRRCQGVYAGGQCPYFALDTVDMCKMHKGDIKLRAKEELSKRIYRVQVWKDRIGEHAEHSNIKSLREEIGITRLLMEETLNMCSGPSDLMMYSNKITDMVTRIQKLVTACHALDQSSGALLDRTAVLNIASTMVEVISEYITDGDILATISDRIVEAVVSAAGTEKVSSLRV